MEPYTTYARDDSYALSFSEYIGTSFDNQDALGLRMTFLLIVKGTGIAIINGKGIGYIAPCAFCLGENEHCVIEDNQENDIRAAFFHPSVVNSYISFENIRDNEEDVALTVMQDKRMFQFFIIRNETFNGKFNFGPITVKKFLSQFEELHKQITEQGKDWPCRCRSYIMAFLFLLDNIYEADLFENKSKTEPLQEDFYPILMYVYHNFDKKITVKDLTEEFHLNRTTFARLFQKNLGEPFLTYLNRLRVTLAATMLRDTGLPISEIMFRVGFTDQVHFLRTLKKFVNMSPSTYREKYSWML